MLYILIQVVYFLYIDDINYMTWWHLPALEAINAKNRGIAILWPRFGYRILVPLGFFSIFLVGRVTKHSLKKTYLDVPGSC